MREINSGELSRQRFLYELTGLTRVNVFRIARFQLGHAATEVFQALRIQISDDARDCFIQRFVIHWFRQIALDDFSLVAFIIGKFDAARIFIARSRLFALANHKFEHIANNRIIAAATLIMGSGFGIAVMHSTENQAQSCSLNAGGIFRLSADQIAFQARAQLG